MLAYLLAATISGAPMHVADDLNAFTFKLTAAVPASATTNLCLSPLSVGICFSTLLNGAAGDSRIVLQSALGMHGKLPDLNAGLKQLTDSLASKNEAEFTIANSVWLKGQFPPSAAFQSTLDKYFNAEFFTFGRVDANLTKRINDWAAVHTKQRIQNLVGDLSSATRLVLANALTFDGKWVGPFEKHATFAAPFSNGDGSVAQVPTMHRRAHERHFVSADGSAGLELGYRGGRYAMFLYLPPKGQGANQALKSMNPTALGALRARLESGEVAIALPKFKVEGNYDLNGPLSRLGMGPLFEQIDLSPVNPNFAHNIQISQVVHKTYLKLDEEGTEAAAATAIILRAGAVPRPNPDEFRADRPFCYVLLDNESGTILFVGTVSKLSA